MLRITWFSAIIALKALFLVSAASADEVKIIDAQGELKTYKRTVEKSVVVPDTPADDRGLTLGIQSGFAQSANMASEEITAAEFPNCTHTKTVQELQSFGPPWARVKTHIPVLYTGCNNEKLIVSINYPTDLVDQAVKEFGTCVGVAIGSAAVAVGIMKNPTIAIPAFKSAFLNCINIAVDNIAINTLRRIEIGLRVTGTPIRWTRRS